MADAPLRLEVTCLGNICRSPMAHVVLEQRLADAGLADDVVDAGRVRMFRSFDPEATEGDEEVDDPWYGGPESFQRVLAVVERTSDAIVAAVPRLRAEATG